MPPAEGRQTLDADRDAIPGVAPGPATALSVAAPRVFRSGMKFNGAAVACQETQEKRNNQEISGNPMPKIT